MRNILTDVTGNTHRAEICIDKLYSPDGADRPPRPVEFRGFEMPPDARMSLAQQLLVRALIARLWRSPVAGPLPRWGSSLHDRFMLQHYVWVDFLDVLADLKAHGFAFRSDWYEAQAEFRFPFCGEVEYEGVQLEIRQALEPWHVLGETGAIGGTARYTDSFDRASSGRSSPPPTLRATSSPATGAASPFGDGDRGRRGRRGALQGVAAGDGHASEGPDPRAARVRHLRQLERAGARRLRLPRRPSGRTNYDTFPVNSNEAEARRLARFEPRGHSPGLYEPPPEAPHPEFPLTLDLRRPAGV